MIRTGLPPYEGRGPELNATISTTQCKVGRITITTPRGVVHVLPLKNATLIVSSAPALAALELWEWLSGMINQGQTANDEKSSGSTWSVTKPATSEFNGWADEVIRRW